MRWTRSSRVAALAALVLAGCGGGDGGGEAAEDAIDLELFGTCIVNRSGSVPTDALNTRPVDFRLSDALREAAGERATGPRASILPRPNAFSAFVGFDRTFSPPGFDAAEFVPAAFVVFPSAEEAREHADDADARHANLLVVYEGEPPEAETGLVEQCVRDPTPRRRSSSSSG